MNSDRLLHRAGFAAIFAIATASMSLLVTIAAMFRRNPGGLLTPAGDATQGEWGSVLKWLALASGFALVVAVRELAQVIARRPIWFFGSAANDAWPLVSERAIRIHTVLAAGFVIGTAVLLKTTLDLLVRESYSQPPRDLSPALSMVALSLLVMAGSPASFASLSFTRWWQTERAMPLGPA